MKGLSSLERTVLECMGLKSLTYREIVNQSGLHENVCFNILQALLIKGILRTNGEDYEIKENLPPLMMEEMNGQEAKEAESLELMEATLALKGEKVFRIRKVAMSEREHKIFVAMLSNLESFLTDVHEKAEKHIPLKERKVVFWGIGEVQHIMHQIVRGR